MRAESAHLVLWGGKYMYQEQPMVAALRPLAASAAAAACVASITAGTDEALVPSTALQPFSSLERLWGWNRRNVKGELRPPDLEPRQPAAGS